MALGVTEVMGTAFVLVGLVVLCLIAAARDRDPGTVLAGAAIGFAILLTFLLAMIPNFLFWHQNGTNKEAGRRFITEQESYGLKIDELVLPSSNASIEKARGAAEAAEYKSPVPSEYGQTLGIVAAFGFGAALLWALRFWSHRGRPHRAPHDREELRANAGLLTLVMVLFGTISGFAILLSLLGFSQVRTWNRVVVIIAFCALLAVGIGLERLHGWASRRFRRPIALRLASLGVLAAFFFANFLTGAPPPAQQASTVDLLVAAQTFGHQMDQALPAGSAVFQLPVMPYPENGPINNLQDYGEILPYVYTQDLRWSYGAMKGRPEADWQLKIDSHDPIAQLPGLRGLGFDGVLVDTNGYADGGDAITAKLETELGPPEVESGNGRWRFWDIRSYAAENHLTTAQLRAAATDLVGPSLIKRLPVTPGASPN
jgi:phosphoglycerol transferase